LPKLRLAEKADYILITLKHFRGDRSAKIVLPPRAKETQV
jgi:hypothetical protein